MEKIRRLASDDFYYFVEHVFSKSFTNFILGEHVKKSCEFLENHDKTMRVSARVHFKSMSLYAHVMWHILKLRYNEETVENHYFSYKAEMASYHVGSRSNKDNIRSLIQANPYFKGIIDNKPNAEALLDYSWTAKGARYTLHPHGMLTFKRGLHCNGTLYIDDALQDPSERLDPKIIYKINDIFYTQVIDIPIGEKSQIHVVGTAQTKHDFYFDKRSKEDFAIMVLPAVSDPTVSEDGFINGGVALWPEWFDLKELMKRQRARGLKTFSQEYMCNPVYSADSFFKMEQLTPLIKFKNVLEFNPEASIVVSGYDIGKHAHPAHFCIFEINKGYRKQLLSKWFDRVDYIDQVRYIEDAIDEYGIDTVYYDATRGELEALEEQGNLPAEFEPINFSKKSKHSMATQFEIAVNNKTIGFVEDTRQIEQILQVVNDLSAIETKGGHGDSFWSIALSFCDEIDAKADIYIG